MAFNTHGSFEYKVIPGKLNYKIDWEYQEELSNPAKFEYAIKYTYYYVYLVDTINAVDSIYQSTGGAKQLIFGPEKTTGYTSGQPLVNMTFYNGFVDCGPTGVSLPYKAPGMNDPLEYGYNPLMCTGSQTVTYTGSVTEPIPKIEIGPNNTWDGKLLYEYNGVRYSSTDALKLETIELEITVEGVSSDFDIDETAYYGREVSISILPKYTGYGRHVISYTLGGTEVPEYGDIFDSAEDGNSLYVSWKIPLRFRSLIKHPYGWNEITFTCETYDISGIYIGSVTKTIPLKFCPEDYGKLLYDIKVNPDAKSIAAAGEGNLIRNISYPIVDLEIIAVGTDPEYPDGTELPGDIIYIWTNFRQVKTVYCMNGDRTIQQSPVYNEGDNETNESMNYFYTQFVFGDGYAPVTSGHFRLNVYDNYGNFEVIETDVPIADYYPVTLSIPEYSLNGAGVLSGSFEGAFWGSNFGVLDNAIGYNIILNDRFFNGNTEVINLGPKDYKIKFYNENIPYEGVYRIKIQVYDRFSSAEAEVTVSGSPIFDWGSTDFGFNVPVAARRGLVLPGNASLSGIDTNDTRKEMLALKDDNNVYLNFSGYSQSDGDTYICGDNIHFLTNGTARLFDLNIPGLLKALTKEYRFPVTFTNPNASMTSANTFANITLYGNTLYLKFDMPWDSLSDGLTTWNTRLCTCTFEHGGKIKSIQSEYNCLVGPKCVMNMTNITLNSTSCSFDLMLETTFSHDPHYYEASGSLPVSIDLDMFID